MYYPVDESRIARKGVKKLDVFSRLLSLDEWDRIDRKEKEDW